MASQKLLALYPNTAKRAPLFVHVRPPLLGGHFLSNDLNKANAMGLTAHSDVAQLYFTGRDIATTAPGLAAELQAGWIAANAALGYTLADLVGGANIVSDLQSLA